MQVALLSRKWANVSYKSKKMSKIQGAAETGAKLRKEKEEEKVSKNVDRVMVTAKPEAEFKAEGFSVEIAQRCQQHRWQQSVEPARAMLGADVPETFVGFDFI